MKSNSPGLYVTRQPIKQTALANLILIVGLLIVVLFPHSKSVIISSLGGVLISVSIALNIWYLFQSAKKLPLHLEADNARVGTFTLNSDSVAKITIMNNTRTIYFEGSNRLNRVACRADKPSFDAVKASIQAWAQRQHIACSDK